MQNSYSDSAVPSSSSSNPIANGRYSMATDLNAMGYPSPNAPLPLAPRKWDEPNSPTSTYQSPFSPPIYESGPSTLSAPDQKGLPTTPNRPDQPNGYNSYFAGPSTSYASSLRSPPLPPKVSDNHPPFSMIPPPLPPKVFSVQVEEERDDPPEPQSSTASFHSFPEPSAEAGPSPTPPTSAEPSAMLAEGVDTASAEEPTDAELDEVLKMSLQSYEEESHQAQTAETDEERILRESLDMYNKQREIEQMAGQEEESEEDMMARICALSLAETVHQQQEIERAILQSSNVAGPSSRGWGYGVASGSGSSSGPGPSSSGAYGSPGPGSASGFPTRPQIVTSLASPQPSRTPSPRPAQLSPVSPSLQTDDSPTTRWANASLPAYEEVISGPGSPGPGLSPRQEPSGPRPGHPIGPSSGESPVSLAPEVSPAWVSSPLDSSPQDDLPIQHERGTNVGAFNGQRPHSRSFAVGGLRPGSSGGSPQLQRSASAQSAIRSRASFDASRGDFSPSSESSPEERMSSSYMTVPAFQMPIPQPAEPAVSPRESVNLSEGNTPASESGPSQDVRDGLGKRIAVEPEYTRGVCELTMLLSPDQVTEQFHSVWIQSTQTR